jgi:3-oxoacyl-(acyl-carrier-protein) synthase
VTGLRELSRAVWDSTEHGEPAPIPGFAGSSFSPLVAQVAGDCMLRRRERGARTAVVLVSVHGDLATAGTVADAVDGGRRVPPLMLFQSVPNSVAGHVAAQWRLTGPVVCLSPVGDPLADGLAEAADLIQDGDADEALVITVAQNPDVATAVLVGPEEDSHG